MKQISIVIPAKDEAESLKVLLPKLKETCPDAEIIVVNDGSADMTSSICLDNQVQELKQPYSKGNGAAIKAGARAAKGEVIVFMDGDGQHQPSEIESLVKRLEQGFDMVVGARSRDGQASVQRSIGNRFYNWLSSWMVGHKVEDLTSGFRAVNRKKFLEYLYLLPNGFSYPTTITMAMFRAGYSVDYIPISVKKRVGKSHLHPLKDGIRFLLIIFKICTLYSPLKLFVPIAILMFVLATGWYGYTFMSANQFTNMSALLYTGSVMVFLMGLISEQITGLMYKKDEH